MNESGVGVTYTIQNGHFVEGCLSLRNFLQYSAHDSPELFSGCGSDVDAYLTREEWQLGRFCREDSSKHRVQRLCESGCLLVGDRIAGGAKQDGTPRPRNQRLDERLFRGARIAGEIENNQAQIGEAGGLI